MIQRFTEMYYDDAVRFAQYIQATEGGEIELVKEEADGFPLPPKHKVFDNMVNCLKIRNIAIEISIATSWVRRLKRFVNLAV